MDVQLKQWAEQIPVGVSWHGSEGAIHCPFHADEAPSCSINIEKQVFICHACAQKGTLKQLADRLGIEYQGNDQNDSNIQKIYPYHDKDGKLIFEAIRYYKNGEKCFYCRQPDGNGGFINNLKGITLLPYRLPALLKAISKGMPVFIVEGERDVKTLWDLGYAGTCNNGGSGKWRACHSKWIPEGIIVYLLGDADEPGERHMASIAEQLSRRKITVKKLSL